MRFEMTEGNPIMRTWIIGGTLVTPQEIITDHALVIEDGKISTIEPESSEKSADSVINAGGMWVAPGLIDVHVHGGSGHDTMDATPEAIHGMARFFAAHGVTSYFPTTMTAPPDAIINAIENVARCPQPTDGAQHLGVHVEGPYINTAFPGAQPSSDIRLPDPAEYRRWLASGVVRLITIAPEIEGAAELIELGVSRGIEFAAGHTGASYEEIIEAAGHGLRQATHTFNAMLGLHHRNPGTLGGVLTDDRIYAQIIGDGIHVHPAMVKLLVRAKGAKRTILITDSMRAAGLQDGLYTLGAQPITVIEGVARTASGALAGSTATLDAVLRNVVKFAGISLPEALAMGTATPAEAMGLTGRKGTLSSGADADVILLDDDLNVRMTMIGGRVIYRKQ
jgi:N-acetylglucosamine-6-phosphate deacetylase